MKKVIGIDLGTSNTFIYLPSKGVVFSEPTVIALKNKDKSVMEIGYLASKMIGRVSDDIEVIKPIKNGVIARINPTIKFLSEAFKRSSIRSIKGYTVIFSTKSDITPVEKNAYLDVCRSFDVADCIFVNQAQLASLGSGISSKDLNPPFFVR